MPQPNPQNAAPVILFFLILVGAIIGAWVGVVLRLALKQPVLPRAEYRVVPWGGKSVLFVLFASFAILLVVPATWRIVQDRGRVAAVPKGERPALTPVQMMTLSALQNVTLLAAIPLILAATSGAGPRDFGLRGPGLGRKCLQGMIAYPVIAPVVFTVMGLSILIFGQNPHPLQTAILLDKTGEMAPLLVTAGVFLAPLAEELIFRGILLGWLTKVALGVRKPEPDETFGFGEILPAADPLAFDVPETRTELVGPESPGLDANPFFADHSSPAKAAPAWIPLAAANGVVSLLFAALHASVWPTPIPIFFLSLALGLLYQRTGSIVGPVALHMLFNGASTLLMFLAVNASQVPLPAPGPNARPDAARPKVIDPIPPPASIFRTWSPG